MQSKFSGWMWVGAARVCAAILVFGLAVVQAGQGQTESVLYSFTGGSDGFGPATGVTRDASGNLFGTTYYGGNFGAGTVFEVTSSGEEKVRYTFTGLGDGGGPSGDLLLDAQGNIFGTTYFGGAFKNGTIFELSSSGTQKVLYSFTGGTDGALPRDGLIRDAQGNFYGTAEYGGTTNNGNVFEFTKTGKLVVLHSFTGGADGGTPMGALLRDAQGNLYGTTYFGGSVGGGTVFRVTPAGKESVLYSFKGFKDATGPQGALVRDAKGNFYGTTITGGQFGSGAVFRLTPAGKITVLHSFGNGADGVFPTATLVQDGKGNLYSTTLFGGASGQGCVFSITLSGSEAVLYSFTGGTDGGKPSADLTLDGEGNLYGTTSVGGASGLGTVFKLTP